MNVQDAIKQSLEDRAELGMPLLLSDDVAGTFEKLRWKVVRQRGSHIILTKPGNIAAFSVPNHQEVARGTVRSPISKAGLTIEEFLEASGR